MPVQVCYAPPPPAAPVYIDLDVVPGTTIAEAIALSDVEARMGQVPLAGCRTGVWGKLKDAQTPVQACDRIEIYRPLIADPMEARRRRAVKKTAAVAKD